MKTSSLLTLLCADVVLATSIGQTHEKRQTLLQLLMPNLSGYGKVKDPPGAAPRRVVLQSDLRIPGVTGIKRIKTRSGPYLVASMAKINPTGHAGMLEAYVDKVIEKPCAGECNILRQVGGLEYPDGTNANIDSGMWLHHMVHFNTGQGTKDYVAMSSNQKTTRSIVSGTCLPFISIGSSPERSERYFVTGNERSVVNYHPGGAEGSAYHLSAGDKFSYLVELMNMNMEDKTVYITMTYDIIDGPLPAGWKQTRTIYLDANSCDTSEVLPPKQTGQFSITSKPWTPNVEGKIVYAMGHLHDGGTQIDMKATTGQSLCKSNAVYSDQPVSPEYTYNEPAGMQMRDKAAKHHIYSMPNCTINDFKVDKLQKSQSWVVEGFYDFDKRQGNLENGKQSEIMAIAVLLVAVDK